jgi:hypothetical protein
MSDLQAAKVQDAKVQDAKVQDHGCVGLLPPMAASVGLSFSSFLSKRLPESS